MAIDLMTEEGKAEAERLSRQLPTGDRAVSELGSLNDLGDDEDDGDEDEDPADFLARYDEALAHVWATRRLMNGLKEQAKRAKSDHELALLRLQQLRKDKAEKDAPRQLALRRTR